MITPKLLIDTTFYPKVGILKVEDGYDAEFSWMKLSFEILSGIGIFKDVEIIYDDIF